MTRIGYAELTERLFPRLSGGIRWGLERTRSLLASAGHPQDRYPSLHVAGTNGKGTVCHMMERALRAYGLRTGLYTSPHLVDFRERIRVDGDPISAEGLLEAANDLWEGIERSEATFFEATTAIAFLALARAGVDIAVVEVGLGGRLDATNVLEPAVCAITRIDVDHAALLGDSLAEIAAEKAGILKPGVPAAIAADQALEVWEVLRKRAAEVGAPVTVADIAAPVTAPAAVGAPASARTAALGPVSLRPAMPGAHSLANAAVAAHALSLLPTGLRPPAEAIAIGVAEARPPGRFERRIWRGSRWILDVAHNPAGMAALARALEAVAPSRPVIAVVGIVADKDVRGMLEAVAPAVDRILLTNPPGVPADRRWRAETWAAPAALAREVEIALLPDFDEALARAAAATRPALRSGGTAVVCGSFHTVGAALARMAADP